MDKLIYGLLSLLLSLLLTKFFIPVLYQLKFGQPIYEEAPEAHRKKQGIPTMGGVVFILVISIVTILATGINGEHIFVILGMLLYGILGLVDDLIKVLLKDNQGLKARHKLLGQFVIAILIGYLVHSRASEILIPFTSNTLKLGVLYYPFVIFFMLAMSNATNLTDGIDGLSSSVSILSLIFFAVITHLTSQADLFVLSIVAIAALLGFLWHNKFPAKIFMGDTGSMALGGMFAVLMLLTQTPLYAFFVCVIFVLESVSVILQVLYFKRTGGKRLFKKTPIHHHFEESGYSENQVVTLFVVINMIGVIVGTIIYRM